MNKKGFTLIELLAVLVVLAILALIAIPIVIKIVNNARNNSYLRCVEGFAKAVENEIYLYATDYPNANLETIGLTYLNDEGYLKIGNSEVSEETKNNFPKIKYSGKHVICSTLRYNNEHLELDNCIVDNNNSIKYKYQNGYAQVVTEEPSYKQELTYIESTGTQYIDTDFADTGGVTVEYGVSYSNVGAQTYGYVVGSHNVSDPFGRNGGYYYSGSTWELGYGDYFPHASLSMNYGNIYDVKFSTIVGSAYLMVNDQTLINESALTTISDNNIYIFYNQFVKNYNRSTTTAKLYYVKIYDSNNNLVRDYIPVLDSNNNPCLFDKVEDKCYYNVGTGEFLYE